MGAGVGWDAAAALGNAARGLDSFDFVITEEEEDNPPL